MHQSGGLASPACSSKAIVKMKFNGEKIWSANCGFHRRFGGLTFTTVTRWVNKWVNRTKFKPLCENCSDLGSISLWPPDKTWEAIQEHHSDDASLNLLFLIHTICLHMIIVTSQKNSLHSSGAPLRWFRNGNLLQGLFLHMKSVQDIMHSPGKENSWMLHSNHALTRRLLIPPLNLNFLGMIGKASRDCSTSFVHPF